MDTLLSQDIISQYEEHQALHADKIILFRIGSFFEILGKNVYEIASLLKLKQTAKVSHGKNVPMCGFPIGNLYEYTKILISEGYSVSIVDEKKKKVGKKTLCERFVSDVITPATSHLYEEYSNPFTSTYIASASCFVNNIVIMFIDISTGETHIEYARNRPDEVINKLALYETQDLIMCEDSIINTESGIYKHNRHIITSHELEKLDINLVCNVKFDNKNIENELTSNERKLLGYIVTWLLKTKSEIVVRVAFVERRLKANFHILRQTAANLCILGGVSYNKSLIGLLDNTLTGQGKRKLKNSIFNLTIDELSVRVRLNLVDIMIQNKNIIDECRKYLYFAEDINRIIFRIVNHKNSEQDIVKLVCTIYAGYKLLHVTKILHSELFKIRPNIGESIVKIYNTISNLFDFSKIYELQIIRMEDILQEDDYPEYKEYINIRRQVIKNIQDEIINLSSTSGITKIKIEEKRNEYYCVAHTKYISALKMLKIEIIYEDEKYIHFKTKIIEDINELNIKNERNIANLFHDIANSISKIITSNISLMTHLSDLIAQIDILQSFATTSIKYSYIKPSISAKSEIKIINGFHPVYSSIKNNNIIKNDVLMDENSKMIIITGSNMSGKSTYLKQVGIICFMVMLGCFVPCDSCTIGIINGIFSRIGAGDDLYEDKSTFFVEMHEMAEMLNRANKNSLCLIDELCRGTNFEEGRDIAEKILIYMHRKINSFIICSTHIYELTDIAKTNKRCKNMHFNTCINENGKVVFDYKIREGISMTSSAKKIASLAGIPDTIYNEM